MLRRTVGERSSFFDLRPDDIPKSLRLGSPENDDPSRLGVEARRKERGGGREGLGDVSFHLERTILERDRKDKNEPRRTELYGLVDDVLDLHLGQGRGKSLGENVD